MKLNIKPAIIILIFFLHNFSIFCDVISLWDGSIINGEITNIIFKSKVSRKPKELTIKNINGIFKIEGDKIFNYWVTSTPEEDLDIYKKMNKPMTDEVKKNIINNYKVRGEDQITITEENHDEEVDKKEEKNTEEKKTGKDNDKKTANEKNPILKNTQNKVGIVLLPIGITLFSAGLGILLYDTIGYFPVVREYSSYAESNTGNQLIYKSYENVYNTNIALFTSSIVILSAGLIISSISFPLLFYDSKKLKVTGNIRIGNGIEFALVCKY